MADPAGIERNFCPKKILVELGIGRFEGQSTIEKSASMFDALLKKFHGASQHVVIDGTRLCLAFHAESHYQRRKHGAILARSETHAQQHLACSKLVIGHLAVGADTG